MTVCFLTILSLRGRAMVKKEEGHIFSLGRHTLFHYFLSETEPDPEPVPIRVLFLSFSSNWIHESCGLAEFQKQSRLCTVPSQITGGHSIYHGDGRKKKLPVSATKGTENNRSVCSSFPTTSIQPRNTKTQRKSFSCCSSRPPLEIQFNNN